MCLAEVMEQRGANYRIALLGREINVWPEPRYQLLRNGFGLNQMFIESYPLRAPGGKWIAVEGVRCCRWHGDRYRLDRLPTAPVEAAFG
jgi:hypothetical protein